MSRINVTKPLLLALLLAGAAQAQTVWRCGPDGRSYADAPCAEGRALQLADARSPAELTAARQVAARDEHLARQLMQERMQREREALAQARGPAAIVATPLGGLKPAAKEPLALSRKPKRQHAHAAARPWPAAARASRRAPG